MASFRVDPHKLSQLQENTDHIRNFCILAHVDHGKTTLSDSLVCSNGVISPKLAGKLRYLDSTEEEQQRGITMHSSAISLVFDLERKNEAANADAQAAAPPAAPEQYLVNLVDCPGHIDFSSDVSTATRLCDGAVIVIDVVEGLCTQTRAVMHKALKERMTPCLVLNKLDRLCLELKLTPVDVRVLIAIQKLNGVVLTFVCAQAFYQLRRLLENVNAYAYSLVTSELRALNDATSTTSSSSSSSSSSNSSSSRPAESSSDQVFVDDIDPDHPLFKQWSFEPESGNVVFACAYDCWGFSIIKFAVMWAKKLGINKAVLQKYLFEDYYFNLKTKKLVKCDSSDDNGEFLLVHCFKACCYTLAAFTVKPMFASMVLDPIWQIYDAAISQHDPEKAAKMANKVNIDCFRSRKSVKYNACLCLYRLVWKWPRGISILEILGPRPKPSFVSGCPSQTVCFAWW
jgi:ribosome assembly protein 1